MKITVLGSGAWGTALALLLLENGNQVAMWSHRSETLWEIRDRGENPKLPGVSVPKQLRLAEDMGCVRDSSVVVLADTFLCYAGDGGKAQPGSTSRHDFGQRGQGD